MEGENTEGKNMEIIKEVEKKVVRNQGVEQEWRMTDHLRDPAKINMKEKTALRHFEGT
jgi:hypothetical protein